MVNFKSKFTGRNLGWLFKPNTEVHGCFYLNTTKKIMYC